MNKGLEALNTIRHIHDMECGEDESINKDFDIIEKELKALEIIKNKDVDVEYFKIKKDKGSLEDYNVRLYDELTQEEYDLLKEVLPWD